MMKQGDRVRLVNREPIDTEACKHATGLYSYVPAIEVGDLGIVRQHSDDNGVFEVCFAQCTIVCDASMVEVVSDEAQNQHSDS